MPISRPPRMIRGSPLYCSLIYNRMMLEVVMLVFNEDNFIEPRPYLLDALLFLGLFLIVVLCPLN